MIYEVTFHIPGTVKVGADSPEEAKQRVEAMDAYELAPALESTVVDKVRQEVDTGPRSPQKPLS